MTRINVVPVETLSNQHLMAEYRELPRIFTMVRKRKKPHIVPPAYCLGSGHMAFFTDKLKWLVDRYMAITNELMTRDYNLNLQIFNDVLDGADELPDELFNDYQPTSEALYLNMARLAKRSPYPNVQEELHQ